MHKRHHWKNIRTLNTNKVDTIASTSSLPLSTFSPNTPTYQNLSYLPSLLAFLDLANHLNSQISQFNLSKEKKIVLGCNLHNKFKEDKLNQSLNNCEYKKNYINIFPCFIGGQSERDKGIFFRIADF